MHVCNHVAEYVEILLKILINIEREKVTEDTLNFIDWILNGVKIPLLMNISFKHHRQFSNSAETDFITTEVQCEKVTQKPHCISGLNDIPKKDNKSQLI